MRKYKIKSEHALVWVWFYPIMLGLETDWDFKRKYFSFTIKLLLFRWDYYVEWERLV